MSKEFRSKGGSSEKTPQLLDSLEYILNAGGLVEQVGIKYRDSSHCFHDRHGTRQDAGIVTTTGGQPGRRAVPVDRFLLSEQRGDGLEGYTEVDVLTIGDAALYAATVVCPRRDATFSVRHEHVVLLAAPAAGSGKAQSVFKAFHGIDAEHGSA